MSCSYTAVGTRKKQTSSSQSSNSPDGMQNRIDRLEGLVLSLMTNGVQSAGATAATRALSMTNSSGSMEYPQDVDVDVDGDDQENAMVKGEGEEAESETDQVSQSLGMMKVDNNKSLYYGEAHWATILSDIAEVKNYFAEHQKQFEDQLRKVQASKTREENVQGPTFLFGSPQTADYAELLASLPKRSVTDKLVTRFFKTLDPVILILHPPSWYRLYEKHWEDPLQTGPVWLGQLFAICCLAMHSYHRLDEEPPEYRGKSLALANEYRALTGQCLHLADITKPVNHMIETLILHLQSEYARNRDGDVSVWVLVGVIVRLAMRMGYHRDPKHYPNIPPFKGEIRRRVWTYVRQSDLLFSFQLGLPSMIRVADCDTEVPRNLFDDDFDEDTKVLPPSRPSTEATPVSYMIAKASIAFVFGKVIESLHSLFTCTYDDIITLDQNLREARAEFPPHLRLLPIEESMDDEGQLVMQRFNLSILYHKGQCVLHRKFLARARENNRYAHSRRTCVDSSMDLLRHQATLHDESRPGRRLHGLKLIISSLNTHDFLLATMIICLDLWYGAESEGAGRSSGDLYTWGLERRADMIHALEVSNEIWNETRDQSIESYKASEILTVILKKLKYCRNQSNGHQAPSSFQNSASGADNSQAYGSQAEEKPEHSAAMTLGMLSNGGMTPNSAAMFNGIYSSVPNSNISMSETRPSGLTPVYSMESSTNNNALASMPFTFLGSGNPIMEMPPASVDWDAWDSYIQNAGLEPTREMWSMNMDLPGSMAVMDSQEQPQQQGNVFGGNGGIFMGVSTPPGNLPL